MTWYCLRNLLIQSTEGIRLALLSQYVSNCTSLIWASLTNVFLVLLTKYRISLWASWSCFYPEAQGEWRIIPNSECAYSSTLSPLLHICGFLSHMLTLHAGILTFIFFTAALAINYALQVLFMSLTITFFLLAAGENGHPQVTKVTSWSTLETMFPGWGLEYIRIWWSTWLIMPRIWGTHITSLFFLFALDVMSFLTHAASGKQAAGYMGYWTALVAFYTGTAELINSVYRYHCSTSPFSWPRNCGSNLFLLAGSDWERP